MRRIIIKERLRESQLCERSDRTDEYNEETNEYFNSLKSIII